MGLSAVIALSVVIENLRHRLSNLPWPWLLVLGVGLGAGLGASALLMVLGLVWHLLQGCRPRR